ncbi:MAG: MFS transporter [Deltaproteobacteria bacterium]|jgi:FSR family fosmidomycin resistance protein-like MFS transporter|nr:MFS transporter [Deltaproteobacteria bacterium]MBW2481862.1 MFS transporter [Deltaproteobacteria bacterium]
MASDSTPKTESSPAGTDRRFDTEKILALSIGHFIHDVYTGFLAPLLPLLIEKLSLSLTQAGFLSTIMQLPALLNPHIGQLADRISGRYFVILAPALTAVPMSLIGMAPSYGVLLILMFITGVSVSVWHVPAPVMIAELSAARKGRGMSFFMTGGELARSVGPLVAVGAVSVFGLEDFYPVMIFGLLATVWLYFKLRTIPVRQVGSRRKFSVLETWRTLSFVLLPLSAILVARGFMHAAMTAFLPTYIKMETGNLWLAGIALTLFEAAGVAGVLMAGSISDWFGRRKTLLVSLLGAPLFLFIFTLSGGWIRLAALIATGFTLLSTSPVMLALVQENARQAPAAANGFYMMASFIARSAVVVVVGFIADRIGLNATYLISAAMGLVGIPFVLMLPRK